MFHFPFYWLSKRSLCLLNGMSMCVWMLAMFWSVLAVGIVLASGLAGTYPVHVVRFRERKRRRRMRRKRFDFYSSVFYIATNCCSFDLWRCLIWFNVLWMEKSGVLFGARITLPKADVMWHQLESWNSRFQLTKLYFTEQMRHVIWRPWRCSTCHITPII